MATTTGARAAATFPVFTPQGAGTPGVAYGTIAIAANPSAADIIQLCRLPAGAIVYGGFLRMTDMDTNGSPTLDIDIGWAANGGTGTSDAADPDGFGNFGVENGTAVTNYLAEGGSLLQLNGTLATLGVVSFTKETIIQATVNAVAATFAAGQLTVVVDYLTP
jgi:hypothetical protein